MNNDIRGWPSPPPSLDDWTQSKKRGGGDGTVPQTKNSSTDNIMDKKIYISRNKIKTQQESELKVKANLISDRKGGSMEEVSEDAIRLQ